MHKVKGADLVAARELVNLAGPDAERSMLGRVSPELRQVYTSALPSSWIPIEQITPLYEAAAAVLFPGAADAFVQLGKAMARKTYKGLYRTFLSIPSMAFLVRMSATMWSSYHDAGKAKVESLSRQGGIMVVRGAPELTRTHLDAVAGHLTFLAENCGCKSVRVLVDDRDPGAWRWVARWA